jgi:flagella basal body P-ring formation protein FlgA
MNKSKIVLIFCVLYCISCFAFGNTQNAELSTQNESDSGLQIYLPREITVQNSTLLLGQVGITRGTETIVKKANLVTLGRFSMPGQEIVIPRNIILSRLASNGFSASDVTFLGAEKVTVKQKQQIIASEDFTNLADDFLKKNISGNSISGWKAVRAAQELIIPDNSEGIKYSCSFEKNIQANQVNVEIAIFSGDKKIGTRSVVFRLEYEFRTLVAVADIAPGEIITSENVKIERRPSNYPEPSDWKLPYGLLAKRAIKANSEIRDDMLCSAELQTIIKRNQNVIIRIEKPGFVITAVGKTLQDGKTGDFIKVRNVDSQRIIIARVNEDGSVEPVS